MGALPFIPTQDPAFWQDPYPYLREAREQSRVAETAEGVLAVLRWDDGVNTMKGTQFIPHGVQVLEQRGFKRTDPLYIWRQNAIGTMEGPDHRRVRSLASGALGKSRMELLRPIIRKHAHALLDELSSAAEFTAQDYAMPLPRRVMMEFLGVDPEEMAESSGSRVNIADCFGPNCTPELRVAANEYIQKSMDHTAAMYERRRRAPRDDLLTHLVNARDERGVLSEGELITLFSTIFGSGGTTGTTIVSGMAELARHPDQAELFRSDPEKWKRGASEEVLRYRPALATIPQMASETMRVFGLDEDLEGGTVVNVLLNSINRDDSQWNDPDRFDITRNPNQYSMTFGIGAHFCLGQALARTTVEEALAIFVERCDEIELREDALGAVCCGEQA